MIALISEICHSVSIQGVDRIKGGGGAKRGRSEKVLGWRLEMTIRSRNIIIAWIICRSSKRLTKLRNKKIYLQCFLINGHPDSNNCRDSGAVVKKEVSTVMGNRATCNLNVIAGKASPT